jgi:hypothetical protein
MKEVYRACSYLELETLLKTGKVTSFQDNTGVISCTLDYSFARRLITNSMFAFSENDFHTKAQQLIVTFNFNKLNNPIEVEYDMDWLDDHEDIKKHVFMTLNLDDFDDIYDDDEEDENYAQTLFDSIAAEQEVIVFNHRMIDGMITKIQSVNQEILDKLEKLYRQSGYKKYVEFSTFI